MERSSRWLNLGLAAVASLASAQVALAHPGHPIAGQDALMTGALHPILGMDHLLAAIATGLLAVRIGSRRAIWVLPITFVGLMLVGGALAAMGVPLPKVEWGIALSVIVLGVMVAVVPSLPLGMAAGLVGLFAVCHGHAHVAEISGQALLPYMAGLALATLMLHASAIGAGTLAIRTNRAPLVRLAGATIAVAFLLILATG